MEKVNLKELYELQAGLDEEIARNHNVNYESTHEKRLLALTVELGELANETRCFKFWSLKGPSPKEVVMDEFADGLHFLLSLGIPLKAKKTEYDLVKPDCDLVEQFHRVYKASLNLKENYNIEAYEDAMQKFLNLTMLIGMNAEDIINSYKLKLEVNHKRQENKY